EEPEALPDRAVEGDADRLSVRHEHEQALGPGRRDPAAELAVRQRHEDLVSRDDERTLTQPLERRPVELLRIEAGELAGREASEEPALALARAHEDELVAVPAMAPDGEAVAGGEQPPRFHGGVHGRSVRAPVGSHNGKPFSSPTARGSCVAPRSSASAATAAYT